MRHPLPFFGLFAVRRVICGPHLCWSCPGSNTHNNGNPAGDGQAGDAGEGTGGEFLTILYFWS